MVKQSEAKKYNLQEALDLVINQGEIVKNDRMGVYLFSDKPNVRFDAGGKTLGTLKRITCQKIEDHSTAPLEYDLRYSLLREFALYDPVEA